MTAKDIAERILKFEGKWSDDPDDPGKQTKWGVTLATAQRFGLDLNGDGEVTIDDLRKLTRSAAIELFLKEYYEIPRINRLLSHVPLSEHGLRASLFDQAVHSGPKASIELLQKTCVLCDEPCKVDGSIGADTMAAVSNIVSRFPKTDDGLYLLTSAYGIERRKRYLGIARNRPKSIKYVLKRNGHKAGWITRAEHFMQSRYQLKNHQWKPIARELLVVQQGAG